MIIFISGGVRSGKSSFAEKLAMQYADDEFLHYIATGKANDEEMEKRIILHRQRRSETNRKWQLWEKSTSVRQLDQHIATGSVILLDCLTLLVANELFSNTNEQQHTYSSASFRKKKLHNIYTDLLILARERILIIVSNELVYERLPTEEGSFAYVEMIGKLHQKLVAEAMFAYLYENGLGIKMKGVHKDTC